MKQRNVCLPDDLWVLVIPAFLVVHAVPVHGRSRRWQKKIFKTGFVCLLRNSQKMERLAINPPLTIDPGGPGAPGLPSDPDSPSLPDNPGNPGGPTGPRDPIGPISPVSPRAPGNPCGPGGPGAPCGPRGPGGPFQLK